MQVTVTFDGDLAEKLLQHSEQEKLEPEMIVHGAVHYWFVMRAQMLRGQP
jgi:hypothetical protein